MAEEPRPADAASVFRIERDALQSPQTLDLLALHLRFMHAHSPPGSVFALDLSGLRDPAVTTWSVWHNADIAGIGALRALPLHGGEIKSMRTHPAYLRCGVAALLLEHIIGEAKSRGCIRLSLETGSGAAFEPALALYRRRGFRDGAAFGSYEKSTFNQFLHLCLSEA